MTDPPHRPPLGSPAAATSKQASFLQALPGAGRKLQARAKVKRKGWQKRGSIKDENMAFESSGTQDVEMKYIYTSAEKKMLGAFCSLQCLSLP